MRISLFPALAGIALLAPTALAGFEAEVSTDIHVGYPAFDAADEDVVVDPVAVGAEKVDLGALPTAADVVAHSIAANGDELFVLDTTTPLSGGFVATPRDVVRWDGLNYTIEFAGEPEGVPDGAAIDAVGVDGAALLLSFDAAVAPGAVFAQDEDLLRFDGTWTLFLDASAAGIPEAADLNAADLFDETGEIALSFDIGGSVDGMPFDDDDVLVYDPASQVWGKRLSQVAALDAADVDAVFIPEPTAAAMSLLACAFLVARLVRRRSRPALPSGRF